MTLRPLSATFRIAALGLALGAAGHVHAMTDAELAAIIDQRLAGDRTGACLAVAVIEPDRVARAWRCADVGDVARIGPDVAFEIGSIAKTMTATLLADLIGKGEASLDDPLADHLPEGTQVPDYDGQPILLRHVVTHTSGLPALPSRMNVTDPRDPYVNLDADALLASLADVDLTHAPGEQYAYSNFASMLLSYALARRAGADFESLIDDKLFTPLGMEGAYVARPPERVRPAQGHTPDTKTTPSWTIATDLAGVGGVRATLDDMVHYVQAQLGLRASPLAKAIALTQQPVATDAASRMGMNWIIAPLDGRDIHLHGGGTGGFSSLVAFDRQRQRGAVVLSDTSLTSLGGLQDIGLHLIDPEQPLGEPRKAARAPDELLEALQGDYTLQGGMTMRLQRQGEGLVARVPGQPEFALAYDSAGDFYPLEHDAALTPRRGKDGSYGFLWKQSGAVFPAVRVEATTSAPSAAPLPLDDYLGEYPLMRGFELHVREHDGVLHAQATGQGEFALERTSTDVFEAPAYGIEIRFVRDDAGKVASLELHQAGQVLRGDRR
ncbi:serine hydrolase [Luteimonas sp. R10]|uniref:serine hydrolase n=1 Tax=Luteimonas sp. R10 TaxID=3108176 RepID=UPI00308ADFD6|nr:serine hydrolase [Luteimonas sp. R10]